MIALTHPIKLMINSQYQFLSSMLDRFPSLLEEWMRKQEEEVKLIAEDSAGGDYEVYSDIYNAEISRIDSCYDEEQLFNQAMMIMVYSYYESTLLKLSIEVKAKEARPSVIANHFGKELDDELMKISNYICSTIEPLRNQLCHNNQGTLFSKKDKRREQHIYNIERLVERKYISIEDGRITFIDKAFIKKVLEGEHKILLKLAEICGFKTRWFTYKDGKSIIYENYDDIKGQEV